MHFVSPCATSSMQQQMGISRVFRYLVLGLFGLVCSDAFAQQAAPAEGAPVTSASPASIEPSKAVVPMEEPMSGDHWTYEIRDEKTGVVSANSTDIVIEVTPTDISMRVRHVRPDKTYSEGFNI